MFARLKQAATNLITPDEKPKEIATTPAAATPKEQPSEQPVQKSQPQESADAASGDTSLDMVLDTSDPILFDLPSPVAHEAPPVRKVITNFVSRRS